MLAMPQPQVLPPQQLKQQQQDKSHQHPFTPTDSVALCAAGKRPSVEIVSLPVDEVVVEAAAAPGAHVADPGTNSSAGGTSTSTTGDPLTTGPTPPFPSSSLSPSSSTYAQQYLQELKQEPSERKRLSKRFSPWANRNSIVARQARKASTTAADASQGKEASSSSSSASASASSSLSSSSSTTAQLDARRTHKHEKAASPRVQLPTGSTASLPSTAAGARRGAGEGEPRDNGQGLPQPHQPPSRPRPHSSSPSSPPLPHSSSPSTTQAAPSPPHDGEDDDDEDTASLDLRQGRGRAKKVDSGHSSKDPSIAEDATSISSGAGLGDATAAKREAQRKMHQTSSRLLRMTDDDRPFTRDFKDLFSTLVVSLPLAQHRVRFQKIDHTFTSEEAITNLGSLKFSQSNRMPDPGDPSRIVTTTTTTTFSMAKEMARSVMQKFLEARFIESADGRNDFASKSAVWQLTSKGMAVLAGFCQRNGITQRHVMEALDSPRNQMHLVILEREADTDKLHRDQATIEVIFRRFAGQDGPNIKNSVSSSDSDSLNEYASGLVGVRMARDRKIGDRLYFNTFTGKATVDWLMDCCTLVDRREVIELATLFCEYGLMQPIEPISTGARFVSSKSSVYYITEKGQRVAGWISSPKPPAENGDAAPRPREMSTRDSNANRMSVIIRDPALRLLFREYLRSTHCEENLSFYLEVKDFLAGYNSAKRSSVTPNFEAIRETLAAAYSLYNAFLAPGSPCELNIDHSLRTALAGRMTRAVGDDDAIVRSLDEVASLFDQAQASVFKLMASDSVPKFLRHPKYAALLRERNLDVALGGR